VPASAYEPEGEHPMGKRTIYITANDMEQLRKLLDEEKDRHGYGNGRGEHLKGLEAELNRSKRVAAQRVPPDVITMHSRAPDRPGER
jgi:hypothetical protein